MNFKNKGIKITETENYYKVEGSAEDAIGSVNKIMNNEDINEILNWVTSAHVNVHEIICAIDILNKTADRIKEDDFEISKHLKNIADMTEERMEMLITLMPIHSLLLDDESKERIKGIMACWAYRDKEHSNHETMHINISLN